MSAFPDIPQHTVQYVALLDFVSLWRVDSDPVGVCGVMLPPQVNVVHLLEVKCINLMHFESEINRL